MTDSAREGSATPLDPVLLPDPGEQPPGETRTLLDDADSGVVQRTVVSGGVTVLTEAGGAGRAVTVGIAVPVGSRDESPELAGASHFLEHLLFKGTARRSALEISAAIDAVGGDLNAFTGKEYTCFYARVLDRDLDLALDVLVDMMLSSRLATADIDSERSVVLAEIAMNDDDPAGMAHELFSAEVFGGTPLADPISGTAVSITDMSAEGVRSHYRRWYAPGNLAVVAAGRVDHEQVVAGVHRGLAAAAAAQADSSPAEAADDASEPPRTRRVVAGDPGLTLPTAAKTVLRDRDIEQANIVLGFPALARTDPRRYALGVFNAVVGGGMSSRLFQRVREERGLAYSVHSFSSMYSDAGAFAVYAGTAPEHLTETLDVTAAVLDEVRARGLTADELNRGRGQYRGGLLLSREESSARMVVLAEAELITGRLIPVAQTLTAIEAVTDDEVHEVAELICAGPRHVSVVGPDVDAASVPWT